MATQNDAPNQGNPRNQPQSGSPRPTPSTNSLPQNGAVSKTAVQAPAPPVVSRQPEVVGMQESAPESIDSVMRQRTPKMLPSRSTQKRVATKSLRNQAIAVAVMLGVIPVVLTGLGAYVGAERSIKDQIKETKAQKASELGDTVNRFIAARYGDIRVLSVLPILTDPKLRAQTTSFQKQTVLDSYVEAYKVYSGIGVFDLDGNVITQSQGATLENPKDKSYFQEVLKTNRPVISAPEKSKSGILSLYFAAPIKDQYTGKTIAVIRSRLPIDPLNEIVRTYGSNSDQYYLVDSAGKFVLASDPKQIDMIAAETFPGFARLNEDGVKVSAEFNNNLVSYSPVRPVPDVPNLNWDVLISTNRDAAFAPLGWIRTIFIVSSLVVAGLVAAIAAYLANQSTRPIINAANAVQKLGEGDLDTRLNIVGEDEMSLLGSNINLMADQIQMLMGEQELEAKRAQLLTDITLKIRQFLNPEYILKTAAKELQQTLKIDRVAVYRLDQQTGLGTVVVESVLPNLPQMLGAKVDNPAFREKHIEHYRNGKIRAIDDIRQDQDASDTHARWLEQYAVRSVLVAPIRVRNQLFGLLVGHQCSQPRPWQSSEINVFTQLATQVGIALDQANLLEQLEKARQQAEVISQEQREQKETLQLQLVDLLSDIEEASRGDLTVRADVTVGEIGTVADFFNAIIESLRQIVIQVKEAATQVNVSLGENEGSIRILADEAMAQAEEITRTLDSVEAMTVSIQEVAGSARQAAEVARTASTTAEASGIAMDRTVVSILNLRETVAETAKKVKRLGESSQQISKVISLINQIALQTNLLAINASIEAARAGEEGRGFAVVAEEVGQLAAQSAAATKEIEQIVENIQLGTSEVVGAMELGTTQVVEGTRLLEEAKNSLGHIVEVSKQIDDLVQSISSATVSQAQTSQAVTSLMKEIAKSSERTSASSRRVSGALKQTVEVAQQLQASVGVFKVGA